GGAWVAFATRYARRGSRFPTNTVSPSSISRAARSTIRSRGTTLSFTIRVSGCGAGVRTRLPPLLAAELRRALLHVRVQTLTGILARKQLLLQLALDRQRLAERDLQARLHRPLDAADRLGRLGRRHELPRVLQHLRI